MEFVIKAVPIRGVSPSSATICGQIVIIGIDIGDLWAIFERARAVIDLRQIDEQPALFLLVESIFAKLRDMQHSEAALSVVASAATGEEAARH